MEQLFDAVGNLDYPRELLEVQIPDDSINETGEVLSIRARTAPWSGPRGRGLAVGVLHREVRTGYKASALAEGWRGLGASSFLSSTLISFQSRDVFLRMLGHFSDAKVGMVQARWEHRNRDESLLTKIQAVALDAHFLIEQVARSRSGRFYPGERGGPGGISWYSHCGSSDGRRYERRTGFGRSGRLSSTTIRPLCVGQSQAEAGRRPRSRSPGEMGRAVVETGMM